MKKITTKNAKLDKMLNEIAAKHLGVETLESRHSDSLDFYDLGVGDLKDALEAAFKAGLEQALKQNEKA